MSVFDFLRQRSAGVSSDRQGALLPGFASLTALIDAYKENKRREAGDPTSLPTALEAFQRENGTILDAYVASHMRAGVLLVRKRKAWHLFDRRRLMVRVDRRDLAVQVKEFDDALYRTLWNARITEREYVLSGQPRKVIADMLFVVLVYLLGLLDPIARRVPAEPGTSPPVPNELTDAERVSLTEGAKSAKAELKALEEYSSQAGLRSTVRVYLLGLPVGILVLVGVVLLLHWFWPGIATVDELRLVVVAGGIGAITSVMFRVSQGQRLEVDTQQGVAVTLLAGGFRPLIGGVFGAALYVLVMGGLLPLDVDDRRQHFFAGLAFLAGFSERWAQDTIVRSAPIAPSPLRSPGKGSTGEGAGRRADDPPSPGSDRPPAG